MRGPPNTVTLIWYSHHYLVGRFLNPAGLYRGYIGIMVRKKEAIGNIKII